MNAKILDKLLDLIRDDKLGAIILLLILLIISVINIFIYRNNKRFQKIYNRVSNFFPWVKKENVVLATFSKHIAVYDKILEPYLLNGCLVIKEDYREKFNRDGSIDIKNLCAIKEKKEESLKKARKRMKNENSLIYLGFPHVPFAFRDGYLFTDVDDVTLYEYQGKDSEYLRKGFFELRKEYNSDLKIHSDYLDKSISSNEIALKIEQSFPISNREIEDTIGAKDIITIAVDNVERWGITSYAQIDLYQKKLREVLKWAKEKQIEKIHIFATTPVTLSFSLGRIIQHYDCDIIVYNYNSGKFDWKINLKVGKIGFVNNNVI
ncbi:SAVED domain-containing protein [Inconstantimicrobium mannanitabidum]|uniref:Uncharacterized protein n=1 Tax=Inconstantimicrobium mannanitabidum TaxID=1604901 RepID=A0ACB5RCA5_9CLOT|nr:SAVED domain-containing protein [Clostridium sp. TW13]GKX66892.1 hypothetical protein rsdtw13_21500 [Clostridium sp. TW13]